MTTVVMALLMPAAGDEYNKEISDDDDDDDDVMMKKGAGTHTDGNDGDNEVKVSAAQRHVEGRMQAAELSEQRARCSGAAQPQGGRFRLHVS